MLLPTNDTFIGNGDPQAWNISSLLNGTSNNISFNVLRAYDAGTEVNDFETSAGNGLFANVSDGQAGVANTGETESGFITLASGADFANYNNLANVTGSDVSAFNFDNYTSIATIQLSTVAAVPEADTYLMLLVGLGLLGFVKRKET